MADDPIPPAPPGRSGSGAGLASQFGTRFLVTDTGRVEAFSDGVFAVAITILVLDLHSPPHPPGRLAGGLLTEWPAYLGYLISFAYIGVIWLNHHQAFNRIDLVDRGLHAANLTLLFTTAALPFPTGVLADTLQEQLTSTDARTAVVLYAIIAAAMCSSWLWIYAHLARHPGILADHVEPHYVRHGQIRSSAGLASYCLGGFLGWLVTPGIALAVFLLLPAFYFITSEGIPRARRRTTRP